MPIGIINRTTNISLENLTGLTNFSRDPMELFINVNNTVYGGYMIFALLWVMLVIMFLALQKREDQPIINIMIASAVVTIISFLYRAIEITRYGVVRGLLTDYQMWIFPIISAICIGISWMIRRND